MVALEKRSPSLFLKISEKAIAIQDKLWYNISTEKFHTTYQEWRRDWPCEARQPVAYKVLIPEDEIVFHTLGMVGQAPGAFLL